MSQAVSLPGEGGMAQDNPRTTALPVTDPPLLRARGYQAEMFERSMKENVIVAMDTGSGKTPIAVLRIIAELERCPVEKMVWFLAPTVTLCTQQHDFIRFQLPAIKTRLLIGSDNVDRWSEQRIWDAALDEIRVVVSTHAVLADALSHGFVKMGDLALIIFDEAHHCTKDHSANRIMRDFYHPVKKALGVSAIPCILGLSASPALGSKQDGLEIIETNLDSRAVTPRKNRDELFKYVHRPTLCRLEYAEHNRAESLNPVLLSLKRICDTASEQKVLALNTNLGTGYPRELAFEQYERQSKWTTQLNKFYTKAVHIYEELGTWGANFFIFETIATLKRNAEEESRLFVGWESDERAFILQHLDQDPLLSLRGHPAADEIAISPKLARLLSFLCQQDYDSCSGLLFVRQRVTVSVLCDLLSAHPETKERFQCATFVGMSNNSNRRYGISELLDLKAQRETLTEFRAKRKNLIIATDVLEEGIDVNACNLVVCFDVPPNLKSFIQRRGRARQEKSQFAILVAENDRKCKFDNWKAMEEDLVQKYQSDTRRLRQIADVEDVEETMEYALTVESTGATLSPALTVAHLYHFCAVLPHQPNVDLRPQFSYTENPLGLITGTVTLPNCLDSSLRVTTGEKSWKTERAARRDAAFHAYSAIYQAGLLNDNLLPLTHDWGYEEERLQEFPSIIDISAQYNPWAEMAQAWETPVLHQTPISIRSADTEDQLEMTLTTPLALPPIPAFTLYWSEDSTFNVRMGDAMVVPSMDTNIISLLKDTTHVLHKSTQSHSAADQQMDWVTLFSPHIEDRQLETWLATNNGRRNALQCFLEGEYGLNGIVRTSNGERRLFHQWRVSSGEAGQKVEIDCVPLPKRRNFLKPAILSKRPTISKSSPAMTSLPAAECTADSLPFTYARFNLFSPSILRYVEVFAMASQLCARVLKGVRIDDLRHITTAISAPSANWIADYQRYEFIGDSVLKFTVSTQLYSDYPTWPEGYLTCKRTSLVSNERLVAAAVEKELDPYIITKEPKFRKWSAPLRSDTQVDRGRRNLGAKVVADVVEALIGAAFVDSGFEAARSCINVFLPTVRINPPNLTANFDEQQRYHEISQAESVIGHQFRNKALLLEAFTHPAHGIDHHIGSYQRLEFLGDAVLDMLIVTYLADFRPELSQGQMTQIKAALVNADFLGFLCLDFSRDREAVARIEESRPGVFDKKVDTEPMQLWRFMRHHSYEIAMLQHACRDRYAQHCGPIHDALRNAAAYPWTQLARLSPDKFFSDLIESIIGAIFVDTHGNLAPCQAFIDRIGLASYARRVTEEDVNVQHPRNALQQIAGSKKVEFAVERDGAEAGDFRCKASLDEVEISEVAGCRSREVAILLAADAAVEIFSRKEGGSIP